MSTVSKTGSALAPMTAARVSVAVTALLLGTVIVWGAAFAPQAAVHNAAHDGRHVAATPCH